MTSPTSATRGKFRPVEPEEKRDHRRAGWPTPRRAVSVYRAWAKSSWRRPAATPANSFQPHERGDMARSKALPRTASRSHLPGAPANECYRLVSMVVFEDGVTQGRCTCNIRGGEDGNGNSRRHERDERGTHAPLRGCLPRRPALTVRTRTASPTRPVRLTRCDGTSWAILLPARPSSCGRRLPVNTARSARRAVGWTPAVGLAEEDPATTSLIPPRTSEALYLPQYLRDESHRFAITAPQAPVEGPAPFGRLIPGLDPTRQAALLSISAPSADSGVFRCEIADGVRRRSSR